MNGTVRMRSVCWAFPALVLAALAAGGCGRDGDAKPAASDGDDVPSGWDTFDHGGVTGAAPESWQTFVMLSSDFLEIVKNGLELTELPEQAEQAVDDLEKADVSDKVLIAMMESDGVPSLNVQLCFPSISPILRRDGNEAASALSRSVGIDVEFHGTLSVDGRDFALFKNTAVPPFDTYSAVTGTTKCANIATLTTNAGDDPMLGDIETFLGLLSVDR